MSEKTEAIVEIPVGRASLEGNLAIPGRAEGLVVFAHGSGSSRHSPRNRSVAAELQKGGLATLLTDLLTPEEEAVDRRTGQYRFDIDLLADRVVGTIDWIAREEQTRQLNIGVFGSSTGAAAALAAAAKRPGDIKAVVSRGGRTDMAANALPIVRAPVLFIAGEKDTTILRINRNSMSHLDVEKKLEIIPGATHLFEEPGALESVALHACAWFRLFLTVRQEQLHSELQGGKDADD